MSAPHLPTNECHLVMPSGRWKDEFVAMMRELQAEGLYGDTDIGNINDDFDRWLVEWERARHETTVAPGMVPATSYWLVVGGRVVGRASVRHRLNEALLLWGGHIGYAIRPSERRKGYGTAALRLALIEARRIGLREVLVTCDNDNVGSRRIIERNGGVLENEVTIPQLAKPKLRFWIGLDQGERSADGAGLKTRAQPTKPLRG